MCAVMSFDDSESVMLESFAEGAVFFIVKPVHLDGLENVWQYAVAAKKGKSLAVEETDGDSSSLFQRKEPGKDKDGKDDDNNPKPKKPGMLRFLKSTFATGHPLLMETAQEYVRMQELHQLRGSTSYPGYGRSCSPHNATRYGTFGNGNHGASSSNTQIQARPGFYDAGSSSQFRFGSPSLHSSSSTLGNGIFGSMNCSHTSLNPGYAGNNNSYAGIGLNTDGLSSVYGSMNGTNQVPPAFTATNQQANTSMLSALDYPGVTDYNPDQPLNNGFDLQLGDDDYLNELSDLIFESNKYQFSNQQQDGNGGVDDPQFRLVVTGNLPVAG
ncbi:hypothetical protein F3Y22_tig00000002pilonHSYRG00275 [Hibiscus syriacus]|uniref:Response regulatory domain-containing protein n=1 Tax=Hibiscus syriacus TaxID=106335 RepID=A0A6A3D3T3_HIBSY|nr:hypothetical protein F3Y22_tig00000002pilonHSYRG00275 [Hibiscus syriacus]